MNSVTCGITYSWEAGNRIGSSVRALEVVYVSYVVSKAALELRLDDDAYNRQACSRMRIMAILDMRINRGRQRKRDTNCCVNFTVARYRARRLLLLLEAW